MTSKEKIDNYLNALGWVFFLLILAAFAEIPFSFLYSKHNLSEVNGTTYNLAIKFIEKLFFNAEHLLIFSTIILAAIINEILFHKYKSITEMFKTLFSRIIAYLSFWKYHTYFYNFLLGFFKDIKSKFNDIKENQPKSEKYSVLGYCVVLLSFYIPIIILSITNWVLFLLGRHLVKSLLICYTIVSLFYCNIKCLENHITQNEVFTFKVDNNSTYILFLVCFALTVNFRISILEAKIEPIKN